MIFQKLSNVEFLTYLSSSSSSIYSFEWSLTMSIEKSSRFYDSVTINGIHDFTSTNKFPCRALDQWTVCIVPQIIIVTNYHLKIAEAVWIIDLLDRGIMCHVISYPERKSCSCLWEGRINGSMHSLSQFLCSTITCYPFVFSLSFVSLRFSLCYYSWKISISFSACFIQDVFSIRRTFTFQIYSFPHCG